MQSLLVECVVRTSLLAAVIALVLYAMRIKAASARHAVWAGVVAVMLALPGWMVWGPKTTLPLLAKQPRRAEIAVAPLWETREISTIVRLRTRPPEPSRFDWNWPTAFVGLYLLVAGVFLLRLAVGSLRVRRLLREAVRRDGNLTHRSCSAPITVGWVMPSVVLPVEWFEWPQARLDAILVHEQEHVRRRDPLFQWLALLNRALFWFHPLAWWLERHLSGLAEEACDMAVLAQGHDPRDYSECLIDLARSVERAGARVNVLGMAMPGAFLPQRIRRMLADSRDSRASRPRLLCTAAICAVLAVIVATGTLVHAQPDSKSQANPAFEVASIRPTSASGFAPPPPPPPPPPGGGVSGAGRGGAKGGGPGVRPAVEHLRFSFTSTLAGLIVKAYGIHGCGLLGEKQDCGMLAGGPAWMHKDSFDIQAKMPEGSPDYSLMQFLDGEAPQLQLMVQALLADRFHLQFHRETKVLPVYTLTVAKRGAKLTPTAGELARLPDGTMVRNRSMLFTIPRLPNGDLDSGNMLMVIRDRSMQELANILSNVMDRPVLNQTGVEGEYDVTMKYERDIDPDDTPGGPPRNGIGGPAFLKALEEQLGLKLESNKAPVEVLVVDRAEKPSEN